MTAMLIWPRYRYSIHAGSSHRSDQDNATVRELPAIDHARLNTASDQLVQVQRDTSTLDAEGPV